jgi:hypothetical protein
LTGVQVDLYLAGNLVGSVQTNLPRCAGELPVTFNVNNLQAGNSYTFTARVSLTSGNGTDINPSNNELIFPPITIPILYDVMMPIISK